MRRNDKAEIFLSIKRKQLDVNKYLFETLYEVMNVQDDQGIVRNQRQNNSANLRRAQNVDK